LASLSDIDAADLRAALVRAAQNTDLAERTLEVVAVVEAAGAPIGIHPVVVGGMAVYFWTANEEFVTYDIDVVMAVPDELAAKLGELGFIRASDGRHWTLEDTEIFLEAPSAHLDSDAVVAEVKLQSGRTAKVLSRVDVLIDRLAEFQATGHETAAQQALALLAGLSKDEADDLDARVATHRVSTILNAVRKLADDLEAGSAPPDSGELHQIARAALRAEYPPKQP
jgi:ABC-type amino acid transport substrate-binding protein